MSSFPLLFFAILMTGGCRQSLLPGSDAQSSSGACPGSGDVAQTIPKNQVQSRVIPKCSFVLAHRSLEAGAARPCSVARYAQLTLRWRVQRSDRTRPDGRVQRIIQASPYRPVLSRSVIVSATTSFSQAPTE
jgi:hypothetical protein